MHRYGRYKDDTGNTINDAAFNATFLGHARMLACVVPAHTTKSHLTCACTHVLLSMPIKTPDRMHHVQLHTRQASENAEVMCHATTRSVQIQSTPSSLSSTNQTGDSPMLYNELQPERVHRLEVTLPHLLLRTHRDYQPRQVPRSVPAGLPTPEKQRRGFPPGGVSGQNVGQPSRVIAE